MTDNISRAAVEAELNTAISRVSGAMEGFSADHPLVRTGEGVLIALESVRLSIRAIPHAPGEVEGLLQAVGAVIEYAFNDEFGCKAVPMEEFNALEAAYRTALSTKSPTGEQD